MPLGPCIVVAAQVTRVQGQSDMSDEELENTAVVPEAPEPVGVEDLECVLELTSEFGTTAPAAPTDAALEELKTEVLSAVRGAITGVMNRHQPPSATPELDLDFSLREPAETPFPEPLQPETAHPEVFTPADLAPNPILAALAAGPEPVLATELADPAVFAEQILIAVPAELSEADHNLPALAASVLLPVAAMPPVAASRGRVPAWTAAALLSISGVAIGAGAAILLVDPTSTAEIRESLRTKLDSLFAGRGSVEVAIDEPVIAEVRPVAIPPVAAPVSELETAGLDAGARSTTSEQAKPPEGSEPALATERKPLGVVSTGAPVIALAPVALNPEPIAPDLTSLSRAVRVAAAADTAAFAHAFEPPVEVSVAVKTVRHATGLDALAALPATVTVAAPPSSGAESESSAIKLTKAVEPAPKPEEPPTGAEPTEPTTPLSAMARANEALRNGDVEKARMLLQAESEAGQVEAMLVLARSFDPSYLKEIGASAGKGNVATAEKLYRAWYAQSVKLGLVSEGINLNRLIRAMARAKP